MTGKGKRIKGIGGNIDDESISVMYVKSEMRIVVGRKRRDRYIC